jgi:exosortase J
MPTLAPGHTPAEPANHSTTAPAAAAGRSAARESGLTLSRAAGLATGISVLGVFAIFSTALFLWGLWTTSPLKSIGGLVPIVSLVLILRAWQAIGWRVHGTWWGLAIVAVTIALVHLRDHAIIELIITPSWAIFVPPHSAVVLAYTAGAVLLFGGVQLFRAALFPILLTWFVNPVPNAFNLLVDLPLQHASAKIARAFAHALGQPLTSDQLRLMFTPDFGMFIAPGCNGIRGAITMGFFALIAGYLYRFRFRFHVLFVAGAVLLGYVFNLLRLCCLVIYYIIALHFPWLQNRAEMGDYIIGACLFLIATFLLFTVILRLSPTGSLRPPPLHISRKPHSNIASRSFVPRLAAFTLLVVLGSVTYVRAIADSRNAPRAVTDPKALGLFPQRVGNYTLDHAWNEYLVAGGPLIFYWAEYAPADGGAHVSVGISPVLGAHDTLLCHAARGEDWLWHDTLMLPTIHAPASFSASFFNDGATQYLEATTVCTGASCGQYSSARQHFGLVYSRPDTYTLLSQSPTRPIPVLLRAETTDTAMAPDLARAQLTANLSHFMSGADLAIFTQPYR